MQSNRQNLGGLPFEEAVQEGRIALWRALVGFDAHKGYQFSTYAYRVIVHQIWKAVKEYCETNRREHALREWVVVFQHWEAGPIQRAKERELRECLHALVSRLPERLSRVMRVRYELDGESWQTNAELGAGMGISGERVRQLQVEALVWLRHPAHSQECGNCCGVTACRNMNGLKSWLRPGCVAGEGAMARPEAARVQEAGFVHHCNLSALQKSSATAMAETDPDTPFAEEKLPFQLSLSRLAELADVSTSLVTLMISNCCSTWSISAACGLCWQSTWAGNRPRARCPLTRFRCSC